MCHWQLVCQCLQLWIPCSVEHWQTSCQWHIQINLPSRVWTLKGIFVKCSLAISTERICCSLVISFCRFFTPGRPAEALSFSKGENASPSGTIRSSSMSLRIFPSSLWVICWWTSEKKPFNAALTILWSSFSEGSSIRKERKRWMAHSNKGECKDRAMDQTLPLS